MQNKIYSSSIRYCPVHAPEKAYDKHLNQAMNDDQTILPFQTWLKRLREEQPHADFWFKFIELDLLIILQFVKSCRSADITLYRETLNSLMPWVFALNDNHYARNLLVHFREMVTLKERHPALYVEFQRCHFMGQKSNENSKVFHEIKYLSN